MNDRLTAVQEIIALHQEGLITKGEARVLLTRFFPELGQLALAKEAAAAA